MLNLTERIGAEIVDETDIFVDVVTRTRVTSVLRGISPIPRSSSANFDATETDSLLGNGRNKIFDETTSILTKAYGTGDTLVDVPRIFKKKSELIKANVLANVIEQQQFKETNE